MFSSKIKRKSGPGQDALKRAQSLKPAHVLVGIPRDAIPYPDGTSVALVGAVHEFGSGTRKIPERSFLRSTINDERKTYTKMLSTIAEFAIDEGRDLKDGLAIVGQVAQGDVQKKIVDIKDPPNTPETIRRKGSSNPLIDTGHMRQSVTYEVREGEPDD